MTEHLHSVYVDGCFRCELGRDEAFIPEHECDAGDFDRVICAEPCGLMHSYCTICGKCAEICPLD